MEEEIKLSEIIPEGLGLFTTESQAQNEDEQMDTENRNENQENCDKTQVENENNEDKETADAENVEKEDFDEFGDDKDKEIPSNEISNKDENLVNVENEQNNNEKVPGSSFLESSDSQLADDEKPNYAESGVDTLQPIQPPQEKYQPNPRNKQNSPPRSPRSPPRSPRKPTFEPAPIESSTVEPICEQILKGEKVTETNPQILAAAVVELENSRNLLMSTGKIKESMEHEKAIGTAKQLQLQAAKVSYQQAYLEEIKQKRKQAQNELDAFTKEAEAAQQEWSEKANISMDQMQNRHEKELQRFDKDWQSDQMRRRFNRCSARLRSMRHQQTLLLNARRFDEAEQVMKMADNLERQEVRESSQNYSNQYLAARKAVENRQKEERAILESTIQARKVELDSIYEKQRQVYDRRFQVLDHEEKLAADPEHVWILQHRNDADMVAKQRAISKRVVRKQTMKTTKYTTLQLPPLQVPKSARSTTRRKK